MILNLRGRSVTKAILKNLQIIMILSIFLIGNAFLTGSVLADEDTDVLVTGDSFVVKTDDIQLLRSRMKSFFSTTENEYCKAMLKIKLFSMEAKEKKIDLEPEIAAELNQMIEQKLSGIYVNRLVKEYKLVPGTVYSYYLSHTDEFMDKDGNPMNLNDELRARIRAGIMKAKISEISNREMAKLKKKYHVNIVNPMCSDKGPGKGPGKGSVQ